MVPCMLDIETPALSMAGDAPAGGPGEQNYFMRRQVSPRPAAAGQAMPLPAPTASPKPSGQQQHCAVSPSPGLVTARDRSRPYLLQEEPRAGGHMPSRGLSPTGAAAIRRSAAAAAGQQQRQQQRRTPSPSSRMHSASPSPRGGRATPAGTPNLVARGAGCCGAKVDSAPRRQGAGWGEICPWRDRVEVSLLRDLMPNGEAALEKKERDAETPHVAKKSDPQAVREASAPSAGDDDLELSATELLEDLLAASSELQQQVPDGGKGGGGDLRDQGADPSPPPEPPLLESTMTLLREVLQAPSPARV
eukprot:TRINITY_DN13908_c0_g1_i1.p1 TRINITY_DN13908_c0_g1~~TRINITY_DN13908_c0_g1_i1.p1  ORF type:complete len:305 (+),score=45.41 TRINITY_DN13908_c0_g1_i1:113-1027(+)